MKIARIVVGIGQLKVVDSPAILVGMALGSCVGLIIYDEDRHTAGLAHIMLPSSPDKHWDAARGASPVCRPSNDCGKDEICDYTSEDGLQARYADLTIPIMLEEIEKFGGTRTACKAKLAGGAQMFSGSDDVRRYIGKRNVEVVKAHLVQHRIPVLSDVTGGEFARTLEFNTEDFTMSIKSFARSKGNHDEETIETEYTTH